MDKYPNHGETCIFKILHVKRVNLTYMYSICEEKMLSVFCAVLAP